MCVFPEDLKYAKSHEWARQDTASGIVTVGITDFAVEQLGDIVYLELPKVGAKVAQAKPFGVIESVKAAVDLYAPVSGEVVEVNAALPKKFDWLTGEPYAKGWMVKIKPSNPGELAGLLSPADYAKLAASEKH